MTEQTSSDWLGLSGRVCVVTGGGGGIGRAVAVSLARAGARVAAIDLDERGLEVTRTELLKISSDPCRDALRHLERRQHRRRVRNHREGARTLRRSRQHRGGAAARRAGKPVAGRMERGAVGQSDRLFPLRPDLRPADARARTRQHRSCFLDRRQPRAGPERRLQRQQGRRHHAVAPACERMGTAGHPQQCRQPRHGDHADEPVVLRYARRYRTRGPPWCRCGGSACPRTSPTPSCIWPATARPMSTATRSRSMAAMPTC